MVLYLESNTNCGDVLKLVGDLRLASLGGDQLLLAGVDATLDVLT